MKSATAVILLVCLIAFFQSSNSTKCYECIFPFDDECDTIINDQFLVDCPENWVCGSTILNGSNGSEKIVFRECEPKDTKYSLNTCNSDRCNGNTFVSNVNTHKADDKIQCYVCTSAPVNNITDPKCENIDNDEYLEICKSGEVCVVFETLYAGGNIQMLFRRCGPKDSKISSQVHCDEDRCNGKNQ